MKCLLNVTAAALAAASFAACNSKDPAPQATEQKSAPVSEQGQAPRQGEEFRSSVTPKTETAGAPADSELSNKVRRALTSSNDMKIGGVEVAAADGVVTLYGTVDAPAEKDKAALLAMEIEGVRSVVNRLVVVRGS